MVTVGSAKGATIPATFGQTKYNVLIDTGAMKSCMSQTYYQQLMLLSCSEEFQGINFFI